MPSPQVPGKGKTKPFYYVEFLHSNGWTNEIHPHAYGHATYRHALKRVNEFLPKWTDQQWRIRKGDSVVARWGHLGIRIRLTLALRIAVDGGSK